VLARTSFIAGPQVAEFESDYAAYIGTRHCVGVANGTDAIEIALRALSVGRGDECILPANTFIATVEAVFRAGAEPVLVDCADDRTYLIDADAVEAAVTPRTRAIIPVHLYGQAAPVEQLLPLAEKIGAWVVEDAAQSQGEPTYPWSAMIVPSRSRRIPGREHDLDVPDNGRFPPSGDASGSASPGPAIVTGSAWRRSTGAACIASPP
jgi:cystathionine beta-lyase/cystathionine gamma-synthase